jgi:RimJ/RimL family protein N-acetyltransferase
MQPITTPRLIIREFTEQDADAVARVLDDCFGAAPRVAREGWLAWSVRNYRALEGLGQPPYGDYAVECRDGGEVIGTVGLVPSFGPFETLPTFASRLRVGATGRVTPEFGLFWAVATPHRRFGYATEAAAAMAAFAFKELNVDRLVATTEHANEPSIAVMRRLGMTVEKNPRAEPEWFQTIGILFNPATR